MITLPRNNSSKVQSPKNTGRHGALCALAPRPAQVTGAAADEYNLNVVICNASVTVARPAVLNLSQWGPGGYPQPPEANVKDVYGFPWPPPGLLGIFFSLRAHPS
jgi:hypothetical protein